MARLEDSVEVTLALTLSNLISLVSSPSGAGWAGDRQQAQLPRGLALSQAGMAVEEAQGPGLANSSWLLHAPCCPQALGRMPLPCSCHSGGPAPIPHFRGHTSSLLPDLPAHS